MSIMITIAIISNSGRDSKNDSSQDSPLCRVNSYAVVKQFQV